MAILVTEYNGHNIQLEGDAESVILAMEAFEIASNLKANQEAQYKLTVDQINGKRIDPTNGSFS